MASQPVDALDLHDVPNVRKIPSREEAEDLLAGRPYGTFVVWRLHKFAIVTYQDPGCKEVAHNVIEKTAEGRFRMRNNSKQEGFPSLVELIASRKYLNASLPIDDINIVTGDAPPRDDYDEAKEERRQRLPLRLPAGVHTTYDPDEERLRMVSELWEEPKALPPYTNFAWGRTLWWVCVVVSACGTLFAAAFMAPWCLHQDTARDDMLAIYTGTQKGLESEVGHIGEDGAKWGMEMEECTSELDAWKGRLVALETKLMHDFDASYISNALRHTVFSVFLGWVCVVLLATAGTPKGRMAKLHLPFRLLRYTCWIVTAVATVVSFQYLMICSETTQLLHMIPFWLRDVEAESVGCATALLEMKTWLHETPPHLWVHLPFGLPVAPVPASRDVPFVVMTFGFVVTCVTIACFAARYYTHQFLMSNHAAAKKKNE